MTSKYDILRRLVVGTNVNGLQVTMRCFIDEDASATISKFYIGRLSTPYSQDIVHQIHDSLQPAGDTPEEQAMVMRRAWFRHFNFVSQDVQAEISWHDDTKRMLLAYTSYHEEIWVSWVFKIADGEPVPMISYWRSPTRFDEIKAIEDIIDLNTLVSEIRLRGSYDWKNAALNLMAIRYNLEEPPEDEPKPDETCRKRAASNITPGLHETTKKFRMKEELPGENLQSSLGTPSRS
ncbi:hypothetical protein K505DRAFT_64829 [Melanomma pulvis-pyrius CBS 109.77]|uniref:Uncharacterized protein n=1 Tax=Melanomma pulvis-pyrius CBS 109.77 TaxID=1314802 RepID=A0A6A6X5F9_9PLEO|nr:hypothetical protein K505DRAFT_64829 [Melanomma pulvis-pyrius CBS 109.77]